MTENSPDGRPPHRRLRLSQWKWFIASALVIGLVGLTWVMVSMEISTTLIVLALLMLVLIGGATSPAWGAGLLRRGEEREARKAALTQEHSGKLL